MKAEERHEPRFMRPKATWPPGPWQDEEDRYEWTTAAGLPGLMVRNFAGAWCGYAAVPPGHRFHGVNYSGCANGHQPQDPKKHLGYLRMKRERARSASERRGWELSIRFYNLRHARGASPMPHWRCQCATVESLIDVHGGLTYSGACQGAICHVPEPGQPDNVWWLGFDCAHAMDYSPGMDSYLSSVRTGSTYKDRAYVQAEVEDLAAQLKEYS